MRGAGGAAQDRRRRHCRRAPEEQRSRAATAEGSGGDAGRSGGVSAGRKWASGGHRGEGAALQLLPSWSFLSSWSLVAAGEMGRKKKIRWDRVVWCVLVRAVWFCVVRAVSCVRA